VCALVCTVACQEDRLYHKLTVCAINRQPPSLWAASSREVAVADYSGIQTAIMTIPLPFTGRVSRLKLRMQCTVSDSPQWDCLASITSVVFYTY
jgi:hypothetical protein